MPSHGGRFRRPLQADDRLRELLGYDALVTDGTPVAVLTKQLLEKRR